MLFYIHWNLCAKEMILKIHCQTLLISKFHPSSHSECLAHTAHTRYASRMLCIQLSWRKFWPTQTYCRYIRYIRIDVSCNPSKYRINLLILYNSNFVCKSEKPIIWVMCWETTSWATEQMNVQYAEHSTHLYQIHTVRHYTIHTRCNGATSVWIVRE